MANRVVVLKSPGFAGLGDLLLSLDRAFLIAQATGRALIVDWRDTPYSRDHINLFTELFQLTGVELLPLSELKKSKGSTYPTLWAGMLDVSMRSLYTSLRDDDWNRSWASTYLDAGSCAFESNAEWLVLWDYASACSRVFQYPSSSTHQCHSIGTHLQPISSIRSTLASFCHQYFTCPMLGIHLRASTEAVEAGKSASLLHTIKKIDQLLSADPRLRLFISSDNQAATQALLHRYPEAILRYQPMPEAGQPLHLAGGLAGSGLQVAVDALIDLFLLSMCQHMVYPSSSSFSIAASRIGSIPPTQSHPIDDAQVPPSSGWHWPSAGWTTRDQMLAIPGSESSHETLLTSNPMVSVLMMTRNHAAFLRQAVESVVAQDISELELLIGEDFSSDDTLTVARALQAEYPKHIRLISADLNVGITSNFLRLVARARAPFIALLEGDDYWLDPTKLRSQIEFLNHHPECCMVAADTENRTHWLPARQIYSLSDLLRRYELHTSTYVIRSDNLNSYPFFPDVIGWESMLLSYLLTRGHCGYIDRLVSFYRRHDGGLWHNADRFNRLVRSRQCIDAMDSFLHGRFTPELVDREFWIYRLDASLPSHGPLRYWLQTLKIQFNQTPRLVRRSFPLYIHLLVFTLLQPWIFLLVRLRMKFALRTRLLKILGPIKEYLLN